MEDKDKKKKSTPWDGDKLNRKADAEFLTNYLVGRYERQPINKKDEFVLNINSEWGFGKTYFLTNWAEQLTSDGYSVIYFDAWRTDFSDQPLLSFISEVREYLNKISGETDPSEHLTNKVTEAAKKLIKLSLPTLLSILIKQLSGYTPEQLAEEQQKLDVPDKGDDSAINALSTLGSKVAEQALQNHETLKSSIEAFRKGLKKLIEAMEEEKRKLPLFIFVDELDRCRPSYAIELLENIKHLFDVPGVYFVVATDSGQLSHSINAVYGNGFNSKRYLRRFFNQEYAFPEPNNYELAEFLFDKYSLHDEKLFSPLIAPPQQNIKPVVEMFNLCATWFGLVPRDQIRMATITENILAVWRGEDRIHVGYLFFLISLKIIDEQMYADYCRSPRTDKITQKINNTVARTAKIYNMVERNSGHSKVPEWTDLHYIFDWYTKYRNHTASGLNSVHPQSNVEMSIIKHLLDDCRKIGILRESDKYHPIKFYMKIVDQGGQLS